MKAFEQRLRKIEAKHATTLTGKTLFPEWLLNDWEQASPIPHYPSTPEMERVIACLTIANAPGIYARAAR